MATEPSNSELGFRASFWQWLRRPQWSLVAPLLLIVFTGAFAWQIFFSQTALDQGLTALHATYRAGRPFAARLAGVGYAPYEQGKRIFDEQQWKLAEEFLFTRTPHLNTPAALHARGKFKLTTQLFDEAIQQFEAALKLDPNNAQLHNDLGVAWLEKATLHRTTPDASQQFLQSRKHLEQALQHDHRNLEALFNLALLDFRQGLWKEAEAGWDLYLTKDARSGWAQEAKNYLSQIKTLKQQTTNSNV